MMKATDKQSIIIACVFLSVPFLNMLRNLQFMGWGYMVGSAFYVALLFTMAVVLIQYATSNEQMHFSTALLKCASKYWAFAFSFMMLILVFVKYVIMNQKREDRHSVRECFSAILLVESRFVCKPQQAQRMSVSRSVSVLRIIVNYDVIFVGYPLWWYDMPKAIYDREIDKAEQTIDEWLKDKEFVN